MFNDEVFSSNIPADLSNISFGSGPSTVYGLAALDASFNANGIAQGTSYNIPGTDLTFFFRQELQFTNLTTNRTYWIDACNNNSSLADTIPFNYDRSQFNSYEPLLFDNAGVVKVPIFKSGAPGLKWLMDYKSGFVQFYGTDSNVDAWAGGPPPVPLNNAPPRLSYIKYTGAKGAAGGGGGGGSGGDASFNSVDISGINLMKIERFRFISNNSGNTLIPPTGSATGYYKIASVDDMKKIKTPNLAETVTQANIQFFTRVNFEDSGANQSNKLQWNGNFDIGVNQTYTFAIAVNPDSFINTNHCLVQAGAFTFPFESLHIVQNPATSKYELYLLFNQYTQLNKYIDLTIVLKPNNENRNPISSKSDNTASNNINWELEPITTPIGTLPTPASGAIPASVNLSREGERSWAGTMLPFFGDRQIASYGNTLLQKYTFENYNSGGSNDFIAQIQQGASGPKMLAASGLFKLFARGQPTPGAAPIYTQEIIANIGIQVTGTGGGSALNEQSFLNVLSNTTSITGNNLINNINIERSGAGSGFYEYIVTVTPNPTIGQFDLHCELTNNNLNPEVFSAPEEKRYWTINKYGSGGSGTLIKRVDTRSPLDSFAAFNNERFLVNKLGMGGGNSSGYGILTEDDSVVDSAIQTNIGGDGNNMIINKLLDGAVVIDANTPASSAGGLKIFNSGTSTLPQISLIPFTGPSTLGNPTFINANSSGSTQFQGSGNMAIQNGIQNFGSFDIYQGNGTTAAASNVFNSEDLGSSRYRVSLNNSRNDTDVIINTPGYNIIDPSGGGGAMEVDSGLDKITFNAPVDFENAVNFNSTVNGQKIALVQERTFNTSGLSTSDWFTLAHTGDGTNRNSLRSDALFVLEGRLGSHHHALIFRAGAKFSSGIYIDVQSSWYATPRIQALRIAYHGTYDGTVLQAQVNTDSGSVSTSNLTLRIYQNKNNAGWVTNSTILPAVPSANNTPTVYVTDNPSNPGANYPNFRESGDIIYDGNGRNTTQTTTSNFLINESALQVREGRNVDFKVSEQNIVLRNTGATSGNILLDTVGTTNENTGSRGISLVSHNGIYLQGSNANTSSSILLKTYGNNTSNNFVRLTANSGPNPSTPGTDNNLTWSVAGLDVDELNITNINNLYGGPNTRLSDMQIRSDNRGLDPAATAVHITNPLKLATNVSSTVNPGINAQTTGCIAFDSQLNSIVCKPNSSGPGPGSAPFVVGTATEITLWDKLTQFSTNYVSGTGAYTRGNISNRHFYWPISAGPVPATGTVFEFYKAPFDGYIVGADFGGTPGHQTSLPAFSIQRFSGFNIPGSRLVLEVGVGGFSSGTISEIGTILEGPSFTQTGVRNTNSIRWQFPINPARNRITFQQGDTLDFRLRYISGIFNDQIRASWTDQTTNGTLVNLNLNLVYIFPH